MAGRDFSAELFGPSAGRDFSSELFGAKPPEKESAFRQVADIPLGIAKGAVQGVRMIADAFGAGSDTSKTIKSAETYLADLMSAQAKNDQQEISRIMKDAEDKGVLDQVKAAVKAFSVAPVDTLSSALGTAAPVIVGALGAKVLGAGALVGTGVSVLTGAGMGAGTVKGSIYEETKDTLKKAGASDEEAERRAQLAQEYNGKNLDQILLGTVLGGAAAVGPLEKGGAAFLARKILGKTGVEATETVAEQAAKGALRRRAEAGVLEAVPEAVQAGQEQVAQNIALQREGFDVPTFRGAAGAATLEAIAGGGLGATLGGGRPEVAPPRTGPLTPAEQAELDRQRASAERPKTTEELLAGIQTGRPTTAEDIARIRDEHETAVIEGLLAQDAEMKRANELAVLQREQQRQQTQLESEAEAIAGGISDIDSRVREGRIFSSVQDLIDRNIPFASTAINDINQKFGVINEAPLTEDERARVENIMGMVNTFTNFVNLPVLAPKPVDQFAENQAMEALIKERTESGQAQPLRTTPPAPSPRIEEAPVSQGVGESPAIRPAGGVEPSAPQDRQLVTTPAAQPAAAAPSPTAPTAVEAPASPDRVAVQSTLNTLNDGDTIVTDDGDRIPVTRVVRNKAGDVTAVVTTRIGEEGYTGIDFDGLASLVTPQPYIDSTTGERKFSAPATIEKPKAAAPAAEKVTPKAGDFVKLTVPGVGGPIGRAGKVEQILPNGNVEIRTQQGEIVTKPAGEVTIVTPAAPATIATTTPVATAVEPSAEQQTKPRLGLVGEQSPEAQDSLRKALSNPNVPRVKNGDELPSWNELPNGFAARQYVRVYDGIEEPVQEIRAPQTANKEPAVVRRGLQSDGKPYGELEATGTLDEVMSGASFNDFNKYFAESGAAAALPAPTAVGPTPSGPVKAAAVRKQPNTVMGSTMLADISNRLGGLDLSLLSEFSTKFLTKRKDKYGRPMTMWRNPMVPGVGTLFRKGGESDYVLIATMLEEAGYLEPGSVERDYKEAGERAKELIKAALNREEVLTLEQQESQSQADEEANRQAWLEQQEELKAERDKAAREAGLTPYEGDLLTDDDIDLFAPTGPQTDEQYAAAMRGLGFDETEIADAVQKKQERERAQKTAPGRPAEARAVPETGEGTEGLERYTPEEVTRKQEEAEQAAAAEKKAKAAEQERLRKEQQAKEEKARADESVKDFELGKSAEEQMTGMGDLFLSIEPTVKSDRLPSLKRGVDNVIKIYEKGWLSTDEFAIRINTLANQIETAKLAKEQAGRQRGADFLRQRLLEAKRRGELSEEAIDFAEWFILQNPKLVDDLGISIRTPKEDGVGGMYSAYNRVMYLMKNRGSETTVVHEILHHLERMMPKEVQSAIRKTWIKSLMEAQKNAKTEADKTFFKNLTDFHFEGGRPVLLQEAIFAIKEGNVSKELYQYTSPSEFWAENASEIMKGRFDVKGSVLGRLKQWLSELKEKARSLFGLENKAAIIRALDSLSKGDGQFVSKNLLDDSKETRQVVKEVRKSGEDRATANFLRWFGDSKVVDEKGEPLVVYHGTANDFSVFGGTGNIAQAMGGTEQSFFFTSTPGRAEDFAAMSGDWYDEATGTRKGGESLMPVYLSLKNPLVVDRLIEDVGEIFDLIAQAQAEGRDGVILPRTYDYSMYHSGAYNEEVPVYIAFKPTQIKSAIGNNGDYSLTNADIRKSIGGVSPGQQALETINRMGMGVKPPEPGTFKKIQKALTDAGENPEGTKESAKKALIKFGDWFETTVFSGDAAWSNTIHRSVIKDMKKNEEVLGKLLEIRQSQTVNADNVVSRGLIEGTIEYDDETKKHQSVKKEENFAALAKKLDELATKYGLTKEQMERIAHTYLVAKRLPGIIKRNEELDAEIKAEEATAKPDRKSIDKWKSLKVFVSPQQEAMVEPGLSLLKDIPELSQIPKMINEIRKNHITFMVDSGLWSAEYAQAMWDNIDWVPFYREEQLEADAGPQEVIRGLQVKSKEFQMKGSEAAVNDVFENMMLWSQYAMNRGIRADKARRMIDVAKDIDVGDRKMAVQVTEEKRGMNIVRIYRDGKQELWDVADPMFMDAFASIQNVSMPMFKWAAKMADILRNSVVLYPLFSVAQVPQDSFAAMYTSGLKPQYALRIPILAVKEFIKTLNKTSATHNELVKYGVVGARTFNAEVMRKDAEIFAGLKPPKGGWNKTKDFLEHIAMSADNAVRQAVYEAARQQGVSKAEALEKAFEIFNVRRRGTSKALNLAGQTIPFFYAYLAAQRVAYQTITGAGTSPTERKAALQTLAATSAAVFTLSMLYAMMVSDDEDYAETPAAVRDRTLTIPGTGGVRIPLRADFFLFPKIIAEHTYLMLTDQGYEDGAKFRRSMRDGLVNAIASPTPLPQIAKPALEVLINYSFFDGKPVIGTFEKQKDLERQFNDSTSEFSKLLGKTGFVSPIAADHLIRGMLGSAGGLALYGTNMFLHSDPDVPRPEMSWKEAAAALPGTSGFLKRPQESALKNDFFILRDEVEKAVNTFNDIKTRSPEGIEAFLADEKQMARLMLGKPVDKINRELSKIRKVMTQITNMPESQMSADEKSENIRQLRELEREILRSVNVKELREMAKI